MRIRFLASLVFFLLGWVIQIKWGNEFGISGAPLVVGSLAASGWLLDWDELLFFSLLATYLMSSPRGVGPELITLFLIPFAVFAARRVGIRRKHATKFAYARGEILAVLGAVCGTLVILAAPYIAMSHVGSLLSALLSGYVLGGILAALLWSLFDFYIVDLFH